MDSQCLVQMCLSAWLSMAAVVSVGDWDWKHSGLALYSVPTRQVSDGGFRLWAFCLVVVRIYTQTHRWLSHNLKESFPPLVVPMEAIGLSSRASPRSIFHLTAGWSVPQSSRSSTNSSLV